MPKIKKNLFFNAFIISFQRFASAALGLVSTPIVLNVLGIEDYGLYTLIVGFVAAFAFVNWSLSMTTQRYVAFAIGEDNMENQNKAFSNAMLIHIAYAFFIFLAIAIFGVFFLDRFLEIPMGRESAAKILLFLVAIITLFSIISTPYLGVIKAHENFVLYAILGVIGSLLKLVMAVVLLFLSENVDKLVIYTSLLLLSAVLVFIINIVVSNKYYKETRFRIKYLHKQTIKEMLSFMGWNLFGSLAVLSRNQGVSILLNIFFGVVKNAAYGIAMQINAAMALLSQGIVGAITPKILKGAGSGNNDKMVAQMQQMTKLTLIFSSFFAIPFLTDSEYLLKLWLKIIPDETVVFSQLIIIFSLVTGLSGGVQTIFNALGKVKIYSIWVSSILLLNIPLSYLMFKFGFASYTILLVAIFLELLALVVRLILLKKIIVFSIFDFLGSVLLRSVLPMVITIFFLKIPYFEGLVSHYKLIVTFAVTISIYPILLYLIALDKNDRINVKNMILNFKKK